MDAIWDSKNECSPEDGSLLRAWVDRGDDDAESCG